MLINEHKPEIRLKYAGTIKDAACEMSLAIKDILLECNNDFIPPLNIRESSTAVLSQQEEREEDIKPYHKLVLSQKNIIAYCGDEIAGIMSFRHNFSSHYYFPQLKEHDIINYVTTICVLNKFRGYRIAGKFYDFIENVNNEIPKDIFGNCIATRTWNTNDSHIKVLIKRGYSLTCTLHNDRVNWVLDEKDSKFKPVDETLNTVYYCKKLAEK